jgi:hypothetical protein
MANRKPGGSQGASQKGRAEEAKVLSPGAAPWFASAFFMRLSDAGTRSEAARARGWWRYGCGSRSCLPIYTYNCSCSALTGAHPKAGTACRTIAALSA